MLPQIKPVPPAGPRHWSSLVKGEWGPRHLHRDKSLPTGEWSKPGPSPAMVATNRPDSRTWGTQDSKHTAQLFNVVFSREQGGSIQQLSHDAAYSPADTDLSGWRCHMWAIKLPKQVLTPRIRVRVQRSQVQPGITPPQTTRVEYPLQLQDP